MHEAQFYRREKETGLICSLCNHACHIKNGQRGICGVRENRDGTLYSLVYGRLIAEHSDPIEKKPLFHFLPGSRSYSIATVGCNFSCLHCQNASISQYPHLHGGAIAGEEKTPEMIVAAARASGCTSISYTYVEPTIFYEFAHDCSTLARKQNLRNIFVSNGYMSPEAARQLAPVLDGINIDIKAFTDDFYKKICKARLQPVLDTVQLMVKLGVWVEVTTLIIPGLNDSEEELRNIARFIRDIDPGIPWHVSAFYPTHLLTKPPPTPRDTLRRAREIGLGEGLHFVYEGNVAGEGGENSFCPSCGNELISRLGFAIQHNSMDGDRCGKCGQVIPGVWS